MWQLGEMQVARMKKDATNESWLIYYLYMHNWRSTYIVTCSLHSFTSIWNLLWIFFNVPMYNNGSLNPPYAPWLCQTCLEKEDGSMIAQCVEALRSSFLALGCSCKPWEASNLFLWQGLDVQKVTQKVLDGKHVFLALHVCNCSC